MRRRQKSKSVCSARGKLWHWRRRGDTPGAQSTFARLRSTPSPKNHLHRDRAGSSARDSGKSLASTGHSGRLRNNPPSDFLRISFDFMVAQLVWATAIARQEMNVHANRKLARIQQSKNRAWSSFLRLRTLRARKSIFCHAITSKVVKDVIFCDERLDILARRGLVFESVLGVTPRPPVGQVGGRGGYHSPTTRPIPKSKDAGIEGVRNEMPRFPRIAN